MTHVFADDWGRRSLGDCAEWLSGGTPSKSRPEYWGGTIPWISAKSLSGFFIEDSERCVTDLGAANGTKVVEKNTILLIVRGMSLKTEFRMGITLRSVAFNQDLKALVPGPDTDPHFLAYALRAQTPAILPLVDEAGHGTGRLPTDLLKALEMPLPPITEQRAIAHILAALDDKIELNRKMNRTLEEMAQAIFKSWFIDFDGVPDADMVESELGPIPKGWKVRRVTEIFSFNPRTKLAKGTLAKFVDMKALSITGCSVVEVGEKVIKGGGSKFIQGDTLLARITPCLENGKTALTDFLDAEEVAFGSTEFIVLRPTGDVSREWVYCMARSDEFRQHAISNMTGSSGRQRVPVDCFDHFVLPEPPAQLLRKFRAIASPSFQKIKANTDESRTLTDLRDSLLPKLISGEIRVPEAQKAMEAVQ